MLDKHRAIFEVSTLIAEHDLKRTSYADCVNPKCRLCQKIERLAMKNLGARKRKNRPSGNARAGLYDARRRARELNPATNQLVKMGYTPERYKSDRLTMFPNDELLRAHYQVNGQALWGFKKIYGLQGPFIKNKYPQASKKAYIRVAKRTETDIEAARQLGLPASVLAGRKRRWGLTGGTIHGVKHRNGETS
jgi:hypothetical protein